MDEFEIKYNDKNIESVNEPMDARPACDKSLIINLVESIINGKNISEAPIIKERITIETTEKLPRRGTNTTPTAPTEMRERGPSFLDLLNSQRSLLYFDDVSMNRKAMLHVLNKFNLNITVPDGIIDVCSDMREIGKMIGKVPASLYAYTLIGMLEFMFMEGVLECYEETSDTNYLCNNISSEVMAFITERIK